MQDTNIGQALCRADHTYQYKTVTSARSTCRAQVKYFPPPPLATTEGLSLLAFSFFVPFLLLFFRHFLSPTHALN